MKFIDPNLIYEVRRPWFRVLHFEMTREQALELFKLEPLVLIDEGLGEFDCWVAECDCGLKISIEFFHMGKNNGTISATEPNPDHVERHMQEWKDYIVKYEPDWFQKETEETLRYHSRKFPEYDLKENYNLQNQVWRQGDDGNPVKIGSCTTKLDAECMLQSLESKVHKQTYWIEKE